MGGSKPFVIFPWKEYWDLEPLPFTFAFHLLTDEHSFSAAMMYHVAIGLKQYVSVTMNLKAQKP
jgi:hypothetical protein